MNEALAHTAEHPIAAAIEAEAPAAAAPGVTRLTVRALGGLDRWLGEVTSTPAGGDVRYRWDFGAKRLRES